MIVCRFYWTPPQVQQLRELYPHQPAKAVASALGAPLASVYAKATRLGLKKSSEYLASASSGRLQHRHQHPASMATQFKPGAKPWNKGKAGTTGLHPNCRATQFKAGRPAEEAANYLSIGSLRINPDGYLEQKVTDDQRLKPARRWVAVHRLVWEAAHGPVPKTHMVVFKNRQRFTRAEDITLERLECISRADNARRNALHQRHPELARLVQLKGAITRQVNRLAKEQTP